MPQQVSIVMLLYYFISYTFSHHHLTCISLIRYGPDLYDQLPTECTRGYSFPFRPFCAVQKDPLCIALAEAVQMMLDNIGLYNKFDAVKKAIEGATVFAIEDVAAFDELSWSKMTPALRKMKLMRLYLQAEKRMAGGCYFCKIHFDNKPLTDYPGLHGHHLKPGKKWFNPSKGATESKVMKAIRRFGFNLTWFGAARREHKKTFPLCLQCHMKVTHDEDEDAAFMKMVEDDGWIVDDDTGIVRHKDKIFFAGFRLFEGYDSDDYDDVPVRRVRSARFCEDCSDD